MAEHTQVQLTFKDEVIDIDEAIAPLLQEVWAAFGMCRLNSCHDNPHGWIWLHFDSSVRASDFLQAVLRTSWEDRPDGLEPISCRVLGAYPWEAPFTDRDDWEVFQEGRAWRYDTHPCVLIEDESCGPLVILPIGLRFPATNYERVLRCMQQFNGTVPEPANDQLELVLGGNASEGRKSASAEQGTERTPQV